MWSLGLLPELASDGGFTNGVELKLINKSKTHGIYLTDMMHTPHRNETDHSDQGGIYNNRGIYNVQDHPGAYRNYTMLTYMYHNVGHGLVIEFSAGIQSQWWGQRVQSFAHDNMGFVPEFNWTTQSTYSQIQPSVQWTITKKLTGYNNKKINR